MGTYEYSRGKHSDKFQTNDPGKPHSNTLISKIQ